MKSKLLTKTRILHDESLIVDAKMYPESYSIWHHHLEYEILYILKHNGIAFIGDKQFEYSPGTLMLFSPNLPHRLLADKGGESDLNQSTEDAYVIHFSRESIHNIINQIPEFNGLNTLLENWSRGLIFPKAASIEMLPVMLEKIISASKFSKMTLLLELLNLLQDEKQFEFISSNTSINSNNIYQGRLEKIYKYSIENFMNSSVCLEQVAKVVNMNNSAFCRYFRQLTNKTYLEFLNEIRIKNACKILLEDSTKSIADVAELSGYNSISNFNKQFKILTGITPSQYVKSRRG